MKEKIAPIALPDPAETVTAEAREPRSISPEPPAAPDLRSSKARILRQGAQMLFWRIFSLGFGAAGSIWAARCLGPENMGISGIILATVTQAVLLIELNQNALLVRHYKSCDADAARLELISTAFTFRLLFCLGIIILAIPITLFIGVPPVWRIGIIASFPLLLVSANQAGWALQAQENVPANYKAAAIPAFIMACLYFGLFRAGTGPGLDIVVQVIGVGCCFLMGWFFAVGKSYRKLVNWQLLPRMWPLLKEGRWLILTGIVIYTYTTLEAPLLGYLRSLAELGQYRTATKLVAVAQSFLTMLSILLYPRLIEWNKIGPHYLWQQQKRIAAAVLAILAPLALLTFWLAPLLYKLTYGPQFQIAAMPFAILLTSKFVVVANSVFSFGLWARREDKALTGVMAATAVTSLVMNLVFIPRFGMLASASINLFSEILILIGAFLLSRPAKTDNNDAGVSV